MDGAALSNAIRIFVGNIFLALAAVGSVSYLVRREVVGLIEFTVLTVAIGTFVYAPETFQSLAQFVADLVTG